MIERSLEKLRHLSDMDDIPSILTQLRWVDLGLAEWAEELIGAGANVGEIAGLLERALREIQNYAPNAS